MKVASIVLVLYATSMVFYGALEMTHDLLHELGKLQITSLHHHSHDHHHSVHDHEHGHPPGHSVSHSHHNENDEDTSVPAQINFFLFMQSGLIFHFTNTGLESTLGTTTTGIHTTDQLPVTPPPERVM
ncbi:MAG TPA: hypothetical protein VGD40_09045 [Chryseosolibacter sp.]